MTALLVVVMATLVVSPLIWRIFALGKSVEVSAARSQARDIATSGLEWARVILREDARVSTVDHLGEPWAVSMQETRLDESLKPDPLGDNTGGNQASLQGLIEDAQARFNLYNLTQAGDVGEKWRFSFLRLCQQLGVSSGQAKIVMDAVLQAQLSTVTIENKNPDKPVLMAPPTPAPVSRWEYFRATPNLEDATWRRLANQVVWLPKPTSVNVNTASAEVIYAASPGMNPSQALQLVESRNRAYFANTADIASRLPGNRGDLDITLLDTKSLFFLVQGQIQVKGAIVRSQSLVQRDGGKTYVVWGIEQ